MSSILVADGGGTKVRWALVSATAPVFYFTTEGLNPALVSDEVVYEYFTRSLTQLRDRDISKVYYYGAGCTPDRLPVVAEAIAKAAICGDVVVGSDMLGAARSLCGGSAGIVCILGTGSNSCYYNGCEIVQSTPSLGFILGDEGSGAVLGRMLVGDVVKRQLPDDLCHAFYEETSLSVPEIIQKVYRQPAPNRFLASLVPFVKRHIDVPQMEAMVVNAFQSFVQRNLVQYSTYGQSPVYFTGSIAEVFAPQLVKALDGAPLGGIVADPLPGLVKQVSL